LNAELEEKTTLLAREAEELLVGSIKGVHVNSMLDVKMPVCY
jgi:hypothetical protein